MAASGDKHGRRGDLEFSLGCFTFDLLVDTGLREFKERPGDINLRIVNLKLTF